MDLTTGLDYLRSRRNGVLITLQGDGRPQSSNITYVVGDDGLIWASTLLRLSSSSPPPGRVGCGPSRR